MALSEQGSELLTFEALQGKLVDVARKGNVSNFSAQALPLRKVELHEVRDNLALHRVLRNVDEQRTGKRLINSFDDVLRIGNLGTFAIIVLQIVNRYQLELALVAFVVC